ncbi:MAG: aldo/keto reductase [Thermoleophilia bacterium]|nr:aldo/keto reductase [Thermoleophilia bacterium]MDH3724885.1 aldo/keto reductase [Thermoleophilia bacterium]
MRRRPFGRIGFSASVVGFGAWAIGASWGEVSEADAMAALHASVDAGTNFFDTADVYGDGRSERLIARLRRERPEADLFVATKAGRRLDPHVADGYNAANLQAFIKRSRENLEMDTLDLVQLHCPPTDVYYRPELFEAMDEMVDRGLIHNYGVSVERVEEALKAIEYPNVASVQIVFNAFRLRPAERFLAEAAKRDVAVIARVPLASGLLTGKMSADSVFGSDDHRNFNREGQAFDVGETFAGVPFEVGLQAVEELRAWVPDGEPMAAFALRWVLTFEQVSTVIPGAKNAAQAAANAAAGGGEPLSDEAMAAVRDVYERLIRPHVHQRW